MASKGEIDAAIKLLCEEWNRAEKAIKLAEQVNGEIVNPAIYELRYGGRRLIEALNLVKDNPTEAKKLLDDAHFDCSRARHDAIDAATSKVAADMAIAVKKLKADVVLDKFPKFTELVGKVQKVRRKIAVSRENREDRNAIYESISAESLDSIIEIFDEFQANEPLLIAAARRQRLFNGSSLLFGVIGVVLTIVFGVVPLFSDGENSPATAQIQAPSEH